jgi:hypothetical protein
MKTPKEILLARHSGVQGKLDNLRTEAVRNMGGPPSTKDTQSFSLLEFLRSLRWHLAAAGATCALVLLLNAEGSAEAPQHMANQASPSPSELLAAVQEHRRELLKWEDETAAALDAPDKTLPPRRSELQTTNVMQIV